MSRKRLASPAEMRGDPVWNSTYRGMMLHGIGDRAILERPSLGLICSIQCPGSVVIKTFDAIRELRDAGIVVAGGFHSPMEKECLEFLLRGKQPVIVCPAKGLGRPRLPANWRSALGDNRLLIVTPFDSSARRTNSSSAQARNEFVCTLSAAVLIPFATLDGKAEAVARRALGRGQPVFTFDDEANAELLRSQAVRYSVADIANAIRSENLKGTLR